MPTTLILATPGFSDLPKYGPAKYLVLALVVETLSQYVLTCVIKQIIITSIFLPWL